MAIFWSGMLDIQLLSYFSVWYNRQYKQLEIDNKEFLTWEVWYEARNKFLETLSNRKYFLSVSEHPFGIYNLANIYTLYSYKTLLYTCNQNDHIKNRLVQKLSEFIYFMSNYWCGIKVQLNKIEAKVNIKLWFSVHAKGSLSSMLLRI